NPALYSSPFGFAEPPEERHDEVVGFAVGIDAATHLGHPELDTVMPQERGGEPVLGAGEGALGLADHERAEPAVLASAVGEESGCLRSARPGQRPRDAD